MLFMVWCGDFYLFWNKRCGIGSADDDFPHNGAADVRKLRLRDQENGFDSISHDMIELGNRFFVIKIGGIAQAAQQKPCANALAVMRGKVFELIDTNTRVFGKNLPEPFQALFMGEKVFFGRINPNGDNNLIEKGQCPFH